MEAEAAEDGSAGMGSTVTWSDKESGRETTLRLVPGVEASPGDGTLSIDSPMGSALAGAKPGDTRTLETPRGPRTIEVLAVEHSQR